VIKVKNVIVGSKTISMDCFKDGSEREKYQVMMDRNTLELLPGNEVNMYVLKAASKARKLYKETGTIPSEFISVWY